MEVSFWNDVWRGIVGSIDGTIYWLVELLLQLVLDLSNTRVFSQSVINDFANRIYVILGLVMLFKIIISFIQILINPDKMDDKEQGVGNVLRRVVISLLLIVLVPSIFSLAMQIQQYVVVIIPKAILGTSAGSIESDSDQNEFMSTGGRIMAFYTYTAFFKYSTPECNDGSIYGTGNDPMAVLVYDVGSAVSHIKDPCLSSTGYNGYKYDYGFPLSTIVGIFLIISLVNIAVAVAIRAIKLGICEFIAPIPIASYIDPKTSKQAFDNWVSISIKTYLDLFSRLIILFFTVFIFITITSDETLNTITANLGGDTTRKSLVIAALIVGLLQFAKQAPKFISDMLGVKEGFGDIGGMFKGEGWKGIGKSIGMVGRALAVPTGAALTATGNFINKRKTGGKIRSALGSAVAGATSATIRGGVAALQGKKAGEIIKAGHLRATKARQNRELDKSNNVGFKDRMKVKTYDLLGIDSPESMSEGKLKAYDRQRSLVATLKRNYNSALEKYADNIDIGSSSQKAYDIFRELIERNGENIMDGNNVELMNILQKVLYRKQITYGDIMTARIAAQQSGSGGADIARALSDSSEIMKGIQSELWMSSTSGNIRDTDGNVFGKLDARDIASSSLDSDIKNTFSQARSAISEDIVQLNGDNKFNLSSNDQFNSEKLFDVFKDNFKAYDDTLSSAQDKERTQVGTSKEAAARNSISRRSGS